jgi:hypothetical protein
MALASYTQNVVNNISKYRRMLPIKFQVCRVRALCMQSQAVRQGAVLGPQHPGALMPSH